VIFIAEPKIGFVIGLDEDLTPDDRHRAAGDPDPVAVETEIEDTPAGRGLVGRERRSPQPAGPKGHEDGVG